MKTQILDLEKKRISVIIVGALLLGFAWQIRGMGTSDPSVVAFLFLAYLAIHFGARKKFALPVFGLIAFSFVLMRTGWGTFVSQAGIPGVIPGYLPPKMDVAVPWWYGYFWLFMVGLSWFGVPSLLFGGYLFTKQRYSPKDVLFIVVLFVLTQYAAGFLAERLIPYLAPEYYHKIYLTGISERSYGSMRGNLSTALAIIPVLLFILFVKRDKMFFKNSATAMLIFAFSLAMADVWRPLSLLTEKITAMEGWGLWEYFTGFFFGLLIFLFYSSFSEKELSETDISPAANGSGMKPPWKFVVNSVGLYFLMLYGIAESLEGGIRKTLSVFGIAYSPDNLMLKVVVGLAGVVLYWLYTKGMICEKFARKLFLEKTLILLMALLFFHYLNFAMN